MDVEAARRASIEALRVKEACIRRLGDLLPGYLDETMETREHLEGGGSGEPVPSGHVGAIAVAITQAIEDLQNARRNSRIATVKLRVAEGMSLGALAKQWGVSRQYIWTLAHTNDPDAPSATA